MAGRRHLRAVRGGRARPQSRVATLSEALILALMVLGVILILRPGGDAARAEVEPASVGSDSGRLVGLGRVVDGDTLDVGMVRVRLYGIDAFERSQTCDRRQGPWDCGAAATEALKARAERQELVCQVLDTDRYGRKVSRCERQGVDVARALVADGLAVAYSRYSRDYIAEEAAARAGAVGAWEGSFDRPEQWRSRSRRETGMSGVAR